MNRISAMKLPRDEQWDLHDELLAGEGPVPLVDYGRVRARPFPWLPFPAAWSCNWCVLADDLDVGGYALTLAGARRRALEHAETHPFPMWVLWGAS